MNAVMSEEIRDRLTKLEVMHEERHRQTLDILQGVNETQKELVGSVNKIALNQQKMENIGKQIDNHGSAIDELEKSVAQHKIALGFIGTAIVLVGGGFVSYLFGLISK